MTIFESKAIIDKPASEVYRFLADMNNHQQLMPDNIQDWASTIDEARFNIQNMASLALRIENRVEDEKITIRPFEKPPFELELQWTLLPQGHATEATFTISADLNMMMKMLAGGPLQKLTSHEVQKLTEALA